MAAFVDTNILVYAFIQSDPVPAEKVAIAFALVTDLLRKQSLLVSAQVLGEFAVNAMRKGKPPLTTEQTAIWVERLSLQTVIPIDASLVQLALARVTTSRISYWDALIVEAALRSGATTLYTEDMHHGTRYETLTLINPFL